jgi:hypothetical protein
MDFKKFVAERDAALLSLDKEKLLAYGKKWGVDWKLKPNDDYWFWVSVHMARTGARSLPMAERIKSKQWLAERGHRSMDDGEVPLPKQEP